MTSRGFGLNPSRRWWVMLLIVVLIASIFRGVGYNFSLPYVDHPDEPVFYLTGQEWRGRFDNLGYLNGYPPIYIWLNIAVQVVLEAVNVTSMAATIAVLRLISGVFSLLTLICIALTARTAFPAGSHFGDAAGLIAGSVWAVSPLVVREGIFATPDPLLYLLVSLALYLAVLVLARRVTPIVALWSVIAGAVAILDKYFTLTAVIPGLVASFEVWRGDRRRGIRLLVASTVILSVVAAVSFAGISVVEREGREAREQGFTNILNAERVLNNLYHAVLPVGAAAFASLLLLGAAAWFIARRRNLTVADPRIIGLSALLIISIPWLSASFGKVSYTERMKDVLPATTAACVVFGIAAAQIMSALARLGDRRITTRTSSIRYLPLIVPAALIVMLFVPQIVESTALLQNRVLPDTRVAVRQWADDNLQPGTVLVSSENHKVFNPFWGGIVGRHWFDWLIVNDWANYAPSDLREQRGISYAVIDYDVWRSGVPSTWRDQTLPLRIFEEPTRSTPLIALRLWRAEHELNVQFGDSIHLIGADLPADKASAGDALALSFYWRADSPPVGDYSIFIHLVPSDGELPVAQADGTPAFAARPTYSWSDPNEILIGEPFTLALPPDLPPGEYHVRIGLYDYQTGQRLPLSDSSDTYDLMDITV